MLFSHAFPPFLIIFFALQSREKEEKRGRKGVEKEKEKEKRIKAGQKPGKRKVPHSPPLCPAFIPHAMRTEGTKAGEKKNGNPKKLIHR